jgi:hypothetical protein
VKFGALLNSSHPPERLIRDGQARDLNTLEQLDALCSRRHWLESTSPRPGNLDRHASHASLNQARAARPRCGSRCRRPRSASSRRFDRRCICSPSSG